MPLVTDMPPMVMVFLLAAVTFAVLGSYVMFVMIAQVNRKLPEHQQISFFLMYPQKWIRIREEYRRLYPNGQLNKLRLLFFGLNFFFLFLILVQMGFFQ